MTKSTILVVEDDLHLMEGIHDILEINGYAVLTANNGVKGLDVLSKQERVPDLIVSDIMMPRMNGYEFLKHVREQERLVNVPFIFLTAKGERVDVNYAHAMGVDAYVIKPFDAEDLLSVVRGKIRRHDEQEEFWRKRIDGQKQRILTILNHEFRTPLTYIVAYADMLPKETDDMGDVDDMRSFLRGINTGANRLRRLVENLILMVELETGEAEEIFKVRAKKMTNSHTLPVLIEAKYQDIAAEKDLTIEVDTRNVPPILGDRPYLTTALECLVDNAIKFSAHKPGETVTLRVYDDGDHVCFSVRDRGRGIPADELDNITGSFYQINRDLYEDQGAGTGLTIANNVARLHGGQVDVTSKLEEGSEFILRVPVYREPAPEAAPQAVTEAAPETPA